MWFGRIVLSQAGLLAVLLAVGIYLFFFYQDPPLVILNDPVPTDKAQYQAGDRIVVSVNAEVRSQSPSTLYIAWRGDQPQPLPKYELPIDAFPLGKIDRTFPIAVVPQILLPGEYYLEIKSVYQVSFLSINRTVPWRSTKFEIVRSQTSESVPVTAYLFMTDQPETSIEMSRELPALPALLEPIQPASSSPVPAPFMTSPTATSAPAPISIATSIPFQSPSDEAPGAKPKPTPAPTSTVQPSDPVLPVVPTIALPDIPPIPTIEIPPLPTIEIPIELPSVVPPIPPVPELPPVNIPPDIIPKSPIGSPRLSTQGECDPNTKDKEHKGKKGNSHDGH